MKDTYTLKQILFALRKEYLKIEKKLEELKKHIISNDNAILDLNLHMRFKELTIDFNLINTLLDKIMLKFCGYSYNSNTYYLFPIIKDKYYFKQKEIFNITEIEELKKELNILFDSEFAQYIDGLSIYSDDKEKNYELFFASIGIGLYKLNNYEENSVMDYDPKDDKIIIKAEKRIITPDYIQEFLGLSFNVNNTNDDINNYISKIIDNYEEKEIYVLENFKSKKIELEITEESKKLILTPKKNIKKI